MRRSGKYKEALAAVLAAGAFASPGNVVGQQSNPPATFAEAAPALRGHGGPIRSLAVLDPTTIATGGFDTAVIVWDVGRRTARRVLRRHDGTVNSIVALRDGCFISGGEDGRINRWCESPGTPVQEIGADGPDQKSPIATLAVSPDGSRLASGAWTRELRLWSLEPGALRTGKSESGRVIAVHKAPITGVAFAVGGRAIASASYDGEVRLSTVDPDGAPAKLERQLQLPTALNGLGILPDGRFVLTASDGRVRVLNTDLTPDFEIELPDGPLTAIAVAPGGKLIAAAGMRTPVTLIDTQSGQVVRRILGPGLPVWALDFSRDGRHLFTGGADRALRQWIVATGEPAGEPVAKPAEPLASASDAHPGARVFRACVACHATGAEDGNRAGPSLYGIMGRRIGTAAGYDYSAALRSMDIVWTPETISRLFEIGPAAMTPGTKMPEQRITDPAERRALVDWLRNATSRAP